MKSNLNSALNRTGLLLGVSAAALLATPANAQETTEPATPPATAAEPETATQPPTPTEPEAPVQEQQEQVAPDSSAATAQQPAAPVESTIVVTGTRIRRPNIDSAVPIITVTGEEFFETGQVSIGDTLNDLPALRSTFSQANSTQFLGTSGLNLLDLRGLGTQRTLVLVNGRRHIASNVLGNAVEVDTNTIPTDLIERVDVVTGGNSAIYGSDAIAGVVNFILRDDYEGVQLRGQGGISKYGDAGNYYLSALAGQNFADGRGNVAVNLEYARQESFYASGRGKCFSTACNWVRVDTDSDNKADGEFDNVFFEDIRGAFFSDQGTIFGGITTADPSDPNIGGSGQFLTPFIFNSDGTLTQQTGQLVGVGPFGSYIGGNGPTFRNAKQFELSPSLNRYAINLVGHFDVSPALVPFVEAKFVRTNSDGTGSGGPFFTASSGEVYPVGHPLEGLGRDAIFTDNPFLTQQARDIIEPFNGSYFYLYRNYLELGTRREKARRDTYRIVGGVRGDFNDDWSYEVSANYGKLKERTKIIGNVNLQRYLLAQDAVVDPATGNIVCRAQIDPQAAISLGQNLDPAFAAAQLAADVAACVPINPFGVGNTSQAAKNYVLQDGLAKGSINEFVLNGFMSGDTSQFLNLPGGPVGFALGAEYRTYDVSYRQDAFTKAGLTFYNAIPDFEPPRFRVKEIFGELRLPILKNQLIHELTVTGAARYAKYKTFGGVWAYNFGAELAPTRDIRFRGNFSRAVRAPSLADAFTPLGTNFNLIIDPCDDENINAGSANRAANCAADGVPSGFDFNYTSSLRFRSGGNPDLKPESSDSITLGGVFTPRFVPGLAISVDYYNIKVDNVITSPAVQDVLDTCYDLSTIDNQFCALFERAGAGGGPAGEIPGRILEGSLQLVPLNFARLKVRGVDVEASYRTRIPKVGRLDTRFIYTRAIQNDQFLDPVDPKFADQLLFEIGDPKNAFNWSTSLKTGPFTFGYQMRYLGKMIINPASYEDFFSKQGREPENIDFAEKRFHGSVFYHDVRGQIDVGKNFTFYLGIDDLTNRKPPDGLTGIGAGSAIYRNIGRFFYAGATARF